jgi:hypothetical protein
MGKMQLGPREWSVVVPAKIRPVRRRGRPGEVRKMIGNSPATDLWAWLGERSGRRVRTVAQPGGGRRELASGEGAARSEPHATKGGVEDPRDKVGAVGRWWHELDPRARRWGAKGGAVVSATGAQRGRERGARWLRRFIEEALRFGARGNGGETPAGRSKYGVRQRGQER